MCLIFLVIVYNVLFYKFNWTKIKTADSELRTAISNNSPFAKLLNTSGINNLPHINIITTNVNVAKAANCANAPINIGLNGTQSDCVRVCANSNAKLMIITDSDEVYYNNAQLPVGNNCILGERPQCNQNTTTILMTINSIVCKPKFPNLIAGPLGTTIVACNDRLIQDPQNILWDNKYNTPVDPLSTMFTSEDEKLPNGTYRFSCKFNGVDEQHNRYIMNPKSRFHPLKNYCTQLLWNASHDIKFVYNPEDDTITCDCGNYQDTRVRNLIVNDQTTPCSDKQITYTTINKDLKQVDLVKKCFTLYSPITDAGEYFPCSNTDQFVKQGSQTETITLQYSEIDAAAIEHPRYKDMTNGKVKIWKNREIC